MTNSEAVSLLMSNQYYERGYKQGVSDVLDKIRAELIQSIQNGTLKIESGNEELFRIIDKYKRESEDNNG